MANWRDLFSGGSALAAIMLAAGVGLQAMETFIGATLLPSVVRDIGGLELFAWNTSVFIIASILASIFAAVRPFGLGPRGLYVFSAAAFGIGSVVCGLAPNMEILLVGRALQGFGGGLLTTLSYSMIRLMLPQPLWGSGFALISSAWGVATVVGPAVGGVFAAFDAWRLAFFVLAPAALLLGVLALRVVPRSSGETGLARLPILQILVMIAAVAAMSLASILTERLWLQLVLIAAAAVAVVGLGLLDIRSPRRLFPTGTFQPRTPIAALFAAMLLVNLAIVCDLFVPLFLQALHGQAPLIAGYLVAFVALGWSGGSIIVANWKGQRERTVLVLGPMLQFAGLAILAVLLGRTNPGGDIALLAPIALGLLLLGTGVGISWPHISARLLGSAPAGEGDLTSAAISMAQLFASGFGAAVAGVIANAAGLAGPAGTAGASAAAHWLYGLFAVVPLAAIPVLWSIARTPEPAYRPAT